ncbi:FAD-dependent monooxygenase [Streptomyces sp. NPDC006984]|uniref:NAD(P)/FAD-dependent oxidoreductase n=1 Tax=Streptomyces sp. NPDC006984 TaxID=3155463 RepID=UPI0033CD934E
MNHAHPRAVVLGSGLAGTLAAAALTRNRFTVDLVEPDQLPTAAAPRKGLPQARHIHLLMSGGAEAIDALVPGTVQRLLDAGARRIPLTTDMVALAPEGWYRRWAGPTRYLIACSRDLLDFTVRRAVLAHPRVTVHQGVKASGLTGDARRVTGTRLQAADGTEAPLAADLVVDATGRAARTPHWLRDMGITGLNEARVDSGLAYASRVYRAPVTDPNWPVIVIQADPRLPQPSRAGGILPIEDGQWLVSMSGTPGAHPTNNPDAFRDFAYQLRHPLVGDLLGHAEPLTGVSVTHGTFNFRRYYENLTPWPDGLIVLGDALAAFNPVYGHGMSVAAQGALALRAETARRPATEPGLARRIQRAIARPVSIAWEMATSQDLRYPHTRATGQALNLAGRFSQWYASRLSHTATGSYRIATAMTEVTTLHAPPLTLAKPSILLAALLGPLRPQLSAPPFARETTLLNQAAALDSGPPVTGTIG